MPARHSWAKLAITLSLVTSLNPSSPLTTTAWGQAPQRSAASAPPVRRGFPPAVRPTTTKSSTSNPTAPVTTPPPSAQNKSSQPNPAPQAPGEGSAAQTAPVRLSLNRDHAALQRYRSVLEVEGQLNPSAKNPVPLQVNADLVYDERITQWQGDRRRAVRAYESVNAELNIAGKIAQRNLAESRRTVVYNGFAEKPAIFCPTEFLERDELELLELPLNTSELDRLLPAEPVSIGSSWKVPADVIPLLLDLETVSDGELTAQLVAIEEDRARIEFAGNLNGFAEGAKTGMDVRGKVNFDLTSQTIRWAAVGIGENRAATANSPALRVQARLRIILGPQTDEVPELSEAELASLDIATQADNPGRQLLSYVSEWANFELIHDRSWYPISERTGPVILRRIENGQMAAQCTISKLNRLPEGKELSMDHFQGDIRQALAQMFGSVIDAQESKTQQNMRQLRVSVTGQASGVPMQWIYYHLSDADGNRWSLVFTCAAEQMDGFAGQDVTLVNSFQHKASAEAAAALNPTVR